MQVKNLNCGTGWKAENLGIGVLMLMTVVITIFLLQWVFDFGKYGIDLTDESFYINFISKPFNYSVSVSQFGFIYHPLYKLVDGDIAGLRLSNIFISYALSFTLAFVFITVVFLNSRLGYFERIVLASSTATGVLIYLQFAGLWLSTPSYNTLAFQALLLAAIGILLSQRAILWISLIGWLLLGIGGALTFLAKPTSAIALMVIVGIYLFFVKNRHSFGAVFAILLAACVVTIFAVLVDGSIGAFIERLQGGVEAARVLGGGHDLMDMFRLNAFSLGAKGWILLIIMTLSVLSASILSRESNVIVRNVGFCISLVFAILSVMVLTDRWIYVLPAGSYYGLLLLSIPFAAMLLAGIYNQKNGLRNVDYGSRYGALVFALLPFVYAFGTNNNYWVLASQASIFWVFSGVFFLKNMQRKELLATLLTMCLALQFIISVVLQVGANHPYRQPQALRNQTFEIALDGNSKLLVADSFGKYLEYVRATADAAAFKPGTPLIDLSGVSPGISYFLHANSVGQAWVIGGYPGSNRLAIEMQKRVTCKDLADAWLLVEPNGVTQISTEILKEFGANWPEDYVLVGEFDASTSGKHEQSRLQQLFKPKRTGEIGELACQSIRNGETK